MLLIKKKLGFDSMNEEKYKIENTQFFPIWKKKSISVYILFTT